MVGAARQTETVHGDGGDGIVGNFKFHAGVDGAGLIFADRENGAGNQLLQSVLRYPDGVTGIDVRQIGIVVGALGGNGEGGKARPDGDLEVFIHHHGDRPFGQTADNVTEQSGGQNARARVADLRFNQIGNGGFHIVAGKGDAGTGPAEDPLNGGKTALLRHGSSGNIQSLHQGIFFTGKSHNKLPSCLIMIEIYIHR